MRFEPPKIDLRREQQAEREIGTTTVSPVLRRVITLIFLGAMIAIPAADMAGSMRASGMPRVISDLADLFVAPAREFAAAEGGWRNRISRANETFKSRAKNFEDSLKNESFLSRFLLPPVQYWTARLVGLGNEKVYLGQGGWLYYRPDFDHTAGVPFLSPVEIHARKMAQGVEADPRPAIIALHRELAERGISLIVVPAPVKSSIEPEHLSGPARALPNTSYETFIADLRSAGINVVDGAAILAAEKARTGRPQFLRTDSHWTPQAMQVVAGEIARQLPPTPERRAFQAGETLTVTNSGDLTRMLRLPANIEREARESAAILPVVEATGEPWKPGGDVLLLGDSFANIYSAPDLQWGETAGLAEHISLASGHGVDRIALNNGGANAARAALAREPGRLDGKVAVIYEFAARELSSGDWKILPLPQNAPRQAPDAQAGKISGTLKEISRSPQPGSLPYNDVIVCLHLDTPQGEALLYCFGMKDNVLTGAERLMPGDRVEVNAVPWAQVEELYGSISRRELLSDASFIETLYWTEEIPAAKP